MSTTTPEFQVTDRALAAELTEYRTRTGLTNPVLAARLGVSATFLSKYLNDKLDHRLGDFEERAKSYLVAVENRLEDATSLFENSVSKNISGRIEVARRTQDMTLIVGEAGVGKTCALKFYAQKNPGTLYIELSSYQRTDRHLAGALFNQLEHRSDWKGNTSRAEFIITQLKGSARVILIDEAHMLDSSGRQFAFNLNRETGCAVVFSGNPEILDKIRRNDQHFSRIGVKGEPSLAAKEIPENAREVARQFSSDEFAEAVADLVSYIATKRGYLRAVRKTVILAYELARLNKFDPRQALREAHRNLVRNYALPSD